MMIKLFENYTNIKDIKKEILIKAIDTHNIAVIDFFVKKGYDINGESVLYDATYDDKVFRYLLSKKSNIEKCIDFGFKERMRDENVQKALIDFGYDNIIYNNVGFNHNLRNDPKYHDIIELYDDSEKYNL
jgi:hypothetical protein